MRNSFYIKSIFLIVIIFIVFESCSKEPIDTNPIDSNPIDSTFSLADCIPQTGFPATASQYAEMVESELGIVPTVYLDSMI